MASAPTNTCRYSRRSAPPSYHKVPYRARATVLDLCDRVILDTSCIHSLHTPLSPYKYVYISLSLSVHIPTLATVGYGRIYIHKHNHTSRMLPSVAKLDPRLPDKNKATTFKQLGRAQRHYAQAGPAPRVSSSISNETSAARVCYDSADNTDPCRRLRPADNSPTRSNARPQ